ncbi:MAG: DUF1036 domain-containing protein [Coleofasciculus sp. S288]|nr:DUF1036 domain-containing protein [Coleofasciculus sp. S288]
MKLLKIHLRSFALAVPASFLMVLLFQKASFAWLKVCNRTPEEIYVAIGYKMNQAIDCCGQSQDSEVVCKKACLFSWISQGWWNINPGECANVLNRNLQYNTVYYYYAHTEGRQREWRGDTPFCTSSSAFQYFHGEGFNCSDTLEDFREVRTRGSRNYTLNLEF